MQHAQGLLLPKEDIRITLRVYVEEDTAARFNLGPYRLEHTLILHVAKGKDHFVALGADYGALSSHVILPLLPELPKRKDADVTMQCRHASRTGLRFWQGYRDPSGS